MVDPEIQSTSPSSKTRRDTQIFSPLPRPSLQPEHQEPQLSFSEPTLRFPRPQGNQSLAHWISSSDPDIMHSTSVPVEDSGLSDSTYELIGGTDTESQDGYYPDNISESVGSLDIHRPDDVVSLAGTENTCDEDSAADITEERHMNEEYDFNQGPEPSHFQMHHLTAGENSDDDDSSSKASLEYADNSLRTPSILTPDASRYLGTQHELAKENGLTRGLLWTHGVSDYIAQAAFSILPVFIAIIALTIVTSIIPGTETDSEPAVPGIAHVPMVTPSTRSQHQNIVTLSSPTSGVALIPLTSSSPDEGLFRSRKPTVSFTPHGKNDVLIHVARDVRDSWMTNQCLDVSVLRSTQELDFSLSAVDDGILVQFPRREAYGVVNLSIKSTCRPKTEKAIKVHFGKGIIVDAFERTKSLAQDLSELVPVAVHEAERCLAGARRVLGSASDSFSHAILVGTERAQDLLISANLGTAGDDVASSISHLLRQTIDLIHSNIVIPQQYSKYAHSVRSVQAQLRLGLLDAQVSARMWWLKIQGKDEEYQMYASMAQVYLQQKKAAAKELLRKLQSRAKTTA